MKPYQVEQIKQPVLNEQNSKQNQSVKEMNNEELYEYAATLCSTLIQSTGNLAETT